MKKAVEGFFKGITCSVAILTTIALLVGLFYVIGRTFGSIWVYVGLAGGFILAVGVSYAVIEWVN